MTSSDLRYELTPAAKAGFPHLSVLGYPESSVDAQVRREYIRCIRGTRELPEFVPTAQSMAVSGLSYCRAASTERSLFQGTYWDYALSQIDRHFNAKSLRSYEEYARATRRWRILPLPLNYLLRVFKEQPSFLPFPAEETPTSGFEAMFTVYEGSKATVWGLLQENAGWRKNLAVMLGPKGGE